jgi:ATP-dependent DNA ligase
VFDDVAKPNLWSRNGLPLEQKFPAIAKGVSKLKLRSTVLDGEIVAVDESGIPRFQLLQRFQKRPTAPTLYYVFYVLWTDGADITSKIVLDRRTRLQEIISVVPGSQLRRIRRGPWLRSIVRRLLGHPRSYGPTQSEHACLFWFGEGQAKYAPSTPWG